MEPVTLATDLILAIQGFAFGLYLLLLLRKKRKTDDITTLMWIGGFFSIGLFALFGALSHGTTSVILGELLWPPTMIFGGISFIFIVTGSIIYQKETNYAKFIVIPVILVIGYFILGFVTGWPFLLWVILLLICSVIIYYFAYEAKKEKKLLAKYLIIGLTVVIIAGLVQGIGGFIGYRAMIGPNNEYLFQPHNDIFHIIAMVGLSIFFIGFRKEILM